MSLHCSSEFLCERGRGNSAFPLETGEVKVAKISRKQLAELNARHYDRLKKVVSSLASASPENQEAYGYLSGLLDVIYEQVSLELNKQNAFDRQKSALEHYAGQEGEWEISVPRVDRVWNNTLLMELAEGKTARRVWETDPLLYREAISVLSKKHGKIKAKGFREKSQATPDFHDGQVLISVKNGKKKVTLLDFGQDLEMTPPIQNQALELLRVVGIPESAAKARKIIDLNYKTASSHAISEEELHAILSKPEKMDRFFRLIALMKQKKYDIPLAEVNWVMDINRWMILGKKIGEPNDAFVTGWIASKSVGFLRALGISPEQAGDMSARLKCFKDSVSHELRKLPGS